MLRACLIQNFKPMKKFKLFFMMFLSAGLLLTACSDDDDDEPAPAPPAPPTQNDPSIADIVINSPDHDSLEKAALRFPDLVLGLQGAATYTVFAPTDAAFVDLLNSNPAWSAINDIDSLSLRAVLGYHAIGDVVINSGDLTDNTYAPTLRPGPNMEFLSLKADVTGGVTINGSANVTTADISASNGVVHVVDEVLAPQNIVDFATQDTRFTSLVSALTAYPSFDYVNTLGGPGPFTVFAPTNDAFQALLDSDSTWNMITDIDSVTLAAVLEYHVVGTGNVQSDQLTQGQTITTLGGDLTVDLTNGAQLLTGSAVQGPVNIIVTDVQGTNGVIHAVDQVLLP